VMEACSGAFVSLVGGLTFSRALSGSKSDRMRAKNATYQRFSCRMSVHDSALKSTAFNSNIARDTATSKYLRSVKQPTLAFKLLFPYLIHYISSLPAQIQHTFRAESSSLELAKQQEQQLPTNRPKLIPSRTTLDEFLNVLTSQNLHQTAFLITTLSSSFLSRTQHRTLLFGYASSSSSSSISLILTHLHFLKSSNIHLSCSTFHYLLQLLSENTSSVQPLLQLYNFISLFYPSCITTQTYCILLNSISTHSQNHVFTINTATTLVNTLLTDSLCLSNNSNRKPNLLLLNLYLLCCQIELNASQMDALVSVFDQCTSSPFNIQPNHTTFRLLSKIVSLNNTNSHVFRVVSLYQSTIQSQISYAIRNNDANQTESLLKLIQTNAFLNQLHNESLYVSISSMHIRQMNANKSVQLLNALEKSRSVSISIVFYNALLAAYRALNEFARAQSLFAAISAPSQKDTARAVQINAETCGIYIDILGRAGLLREMVELICQIERGTGVGAHVQLDVKMMTAAINGALRTGNVAVAQSLLNTMNSNGLSLNPITFGTLIQRCCDRGELELAQWHYRALIHSLAGCESVEIARCLRLDVIRSMFEAGVSGGDFNFVHFVVHSVFYRAFVLVPSAFRRDEKAKMHNWIASLHRNSSATSNRHDIGALLSETLESLTRANLSSTGFK